MPKRRHKHGLHATQPGHTAKKQRTSQHTQQRPFLGFKHARADPGQNRAAYGSVDPKRPASHGLQRPGEQPWGFEGDRHRSLEPQSPREPSLGFGGGRGVVRLDAEGLTPEGFWDACVRTRVPAVIQGFLTDATWHAGERWTPEYLIQKAVRYHFHQHWLLLLKCGTV
jgi:hypothetical protein